MSGFHALARFGIALLLLMTTASLGAGEVIGVTIKADDEPLEGQILGGQVVIDAHSITKPIEVTVVARQVDGNRRLVGVAAATRLTISKSGDYPIDLETQLPVTIAPRVKDSVLWVMVVPKDVGIKDAEATVPLNPTQASGKVVVDSFNATTLSREFVAGAPNTLQLHYRVRNNTAEQQKFKVIETVSIARVGGAAPLPFKPVEWGATLAGSGHVTAPPDRPGFELNFPEAGEYVIIYEIAGDQLIPYRGAVHVHVKAGAGAPGAGTTEAEKQGQLTGTFQIARSTLKPNEKTIVTLEYKMTDLASADVDETIHIFNADGTEAIKPRFMSVEMEKGKPVKRRLEVSASKEGRYRMTVKVKGAKTNEWTDELTFEVKADPTTQPTTAPAITTGSTGTPGTYGLVKKVVGKAPGPMTNGDVTMSGSISESSYSASVQRTGTYAANASFELKWAAPPAVLKSGETITLTCSASSSSSAASGKEADKPIMGASARWVYIGNGDVLENTSAFAGMGSGGFVGSSNAKAVVKIGSGGEITLYTKHSGWTWGSSDNWTPCTYTYKWNAPPTVQPESPATQPAGGDTVVCESLDPPTTQPAERIQAQLDQAVLTLWAGETSQIVNVEIWNYRRRTEDRVEVIFPQKTDNWASLPGQIVVGGGDGSYWPPMMGTPKHIDGYFFSARVTAPDSEQDIVWIVRQKGAGEVRLNLRVIVKARKPVPTNFAGKWNSDLGVLYLTQEGNHVKGTWNDGKATLEGDVVGNVLTFTWSDASTSRSGAGRFTLDGDALHFYGYYTNAPDGPDVPKDRQKIWRSGDRLP